jgi:rubredoxin
MAPFVSAHDPTVICSDCNEADVKAKKMVGAPSPFSFAPADIGRFIVPAPQSSHRIDRDVLSDLWSRRSKLFDRRVRMIRRLVEFTLSEEHWYQPSDHRDRPDSIAGRAATVLVNLAGRSHPEMPHPSSRLEAYLRATAAPVVSGTTSRTWRNHRSRVLTHPPDHNTVAAVAGTSPFWHSVPDDWCCPCCARGKRAIIQPSGSSKATFTTDTRRQYGGGPSEKGVACCRECGWAVSKLAKEAGVEHYHVSFDDVRAVIKPRRNGSHGLHSDARVDLVVERITARQPEASWE